MPERKHELTKLVNRMAAGSAPDSPADVDALHGELHRIARGLLRRESSHQSLQATALVNEAYLRLFARGTTGRPAEGEPLATGSGGSGPIWANRAHFFGAAAEVMRRILVEAARRRLARKRGGDHRRDTTDLDRIVAPTRDAQVVAVHDVLDRLHAVDPQAAQLVKLRFFVGLPMAEIAHVMGVSIRTAGNIWAYGRAWLRRELEHDPEGNAPAGGPRTAQEHPRE